MATNSEDLLNPTMSMLLDDAGEKISSEINCVKLGKVDSKAGEKTVNVKIATDENVVQLRDVPVFQLGTSGGYIHLPIGGNDSNLVITIDHCIDDAKDADFGDVSSPEDDRSHSLSDSVCLPITLDKNSSSDLVIEASTIKMGEGATEAAIKGNSYNTAFNTFLTALNTFVAAVVVPTGVADANVKTTMQGAITTLQGLLSSTLTTKVKIE